MTEVEQPPQNGIDLSAAEDEDHNRTRPADIEQDMREMERRKRVESIMSSKIFREELERIVDTARETGNTAGILQQISDIVGGPSSRIGSVFKSSSCLLPINDIRGVESMGYAKGEKILRCKLAATFRLLDLYGWTQGLGAQITARLKVDQENFLVNPYGLMYHEITASSLNKVDMQGNVVEQGTTNFGVNKTHFALHSAVHAARPDIRCAIYIGCSPVVAVSSLKLGLLPISKEACVLGEISNHPYIGSLLDSEERDQIIRHLGPNSKVMLLSNHGALCCGDTIEESFHYASHLVAACETQLKLLPAGLENLNLISEETRKIIYEQSRRPPEDLEKKFAALSTNEQQQPQQQQHPDEEVKETTHKYVGTVPKWRIGGAEFEAMMRMLDNAGYRTGYIYRHPLVKSEVPRPKNDVELPPAVSSLGYLLEEEELFNKGIWKRGDLRKGGDRSKWLNSPNVYQKVEVLETGTPDPKKITKWVAEGSPTHSTPVRIDDALQFVPTNTNPREFKRLQQQIKDNRRADKISAGPQSHILEGVTWDEANRIRDATVSATGDHVVHMGAASKGIIQRGYQHNATVYKAPYAKNPFDNVTDDELNEYKRTVERKKKSIHGEYTDTDFSESEALNSIAAQKHKTAQSEPEDIAEHQVMRIETKQAPVPSQAEVVLSDATLSFINGERSHTATNRGRPPTGRESEEKIKEEVFEEEQEQNHSPDSVRRRSVAKKLFLPDAYRKYGKPLLKELKNVFAKKSPNAKIEIAEDNKEVNTECNEESVETNEQLYETAFDNDLTMTQTSPFANADHSCSNPQCKEIDYADYVPMIKIDSDQVSYASSVETFETYDVDLEGANNTSIFVNVSDVAFYDPDNLFKVSEKCHTPAVCVRVLKSLYKSFDYNLYSGDAAQTPRTVASTVSSSPARSTKTNYTTGSGTSAVSYYGSEQLKQQPSAGYRTVSHFGFISPREDPQPDHKHIPQVNTHTSYRPLRRSISYEALFATARYADLCEHCFERIIRLKPELSEKPTRLRNLATMSPTHSAASGSRKFVQQHDNNFNDCEYYVDMDEYAIIGGGDGEVDDDKKEECYDYVSVDYDKKPVPPYKLKILQTVPEYEELCTMDMDSEENSKNCAAVQKTPSHLSFFEKISRFNYSEESTNQNFQQTREVSSNITVPLITDDEDGGDGAGDTLETGITKVEDENDSNKRKIYMQQEGSPSIVEIWEFGNFREFGEHETECGNNNNQNDSSSSSSVAIEPAPVETSTQERRLMTREKRNERKTEFQELWEEHIHYFEHRDSYEDSDSDCEMNTTNTNQSLENGDAKECGMSHSADMSNDKMNRNANNPQENGESEEFAELQLNSADFANRNANKPQKNGESHKCAELLSNPVFGTHDDMNRNDNTPQKNEESHECSELELNPAYLANDEINRNVSEPLENGENLSFDKLVANPAGFFYDGETNEKSLTSFESILNSTQNTLPFEDSDDDGDGDDVVNVTSHTTFIIDGVETKEQLLQVFANNEIIEATALSKSTKNYPRCVQSISIKNAGCGDHTSGNSNNHNQQKAQPLPEKPIILNVQVLPVIDKNIIEALAPQADSDKVHFHSLPTRSYPEGYILAGKAVASKQDANGDNAKSDEEEILLYRRKSIISWIDQQKSPQSNNSNDSFECSSRDFEAWFDDNFRYEDIVDQKVGSNSKSNTSKSSKSKSLGWEQQKFDVSPTKSMAIELADDDQQQKNTSVVRSLIKFYDDQCELAEGVHQELNESPKPIGHSTPESKLENKRSSIDVKKHTNEANKANIEAEVDCNVQGKLVVSNDILPNKNENDCYDDDCYKTYSDSVLVTRKKLDTHLNHATTLRGSSFFQQSKSADDIWYFAGARTDAKTYNYICQLNTEIEQAFGSSSNTSENDSSDQEDNTDGDDMYLDFSQPEDEDEDQEEEEECKTPTQIYNRRAANRRNLNKTPPQCKCFAALDFVELKSPPLHTIKEEAEEVESLCGEKKSKAAKSLAYEQLENAGDNRDVKNEKTLFDENMNMNENDVDMLGKKNMPMQSVNLNEDQDILSTIPNMKHVEMEKECREFQMDLKAINQDKSDEEQEEEHKEEHEDDNIIQIFKQFSPKLPNQPLSSDDDDENDYTVGSDNEDFTPTERRILKKIEKNDLKKELIFSKIDNSIRNKLTPRKLQDLIKSTSADGLNCSSSSLASISGGIIAPNNSNNSIRSEPNNSVPGDINEKEARRSRSLTSLKDQHTTACGSSESSSARSTTSNNDELKVRRSRTTGRKLVKRNFILENIRNASVPRLKNHKKSVDRVAALRNENENENSSSSENNSPTPSVTSIGKVISKTSMASMVPVYSFQSKLVRGSPKIWFALGKDKTKKSKTGSTKPIKKETFENDNLSQRSVASTTSSTRVDRKIEDLGDEIKKLKPKLEHYHNIVEEYSENVERCTRDIDECIAVQLEIAEDQREFCEMVATNQCDAGQGIVRNAETEDNVSENFEKQV